MLCGEDGRTWWGEGKVGWLLPSDLGLERDGWASGGEYIFEYMAIFEYWLNRIGQASLNTLMFRAARRSAKNPIIRFLYIPLY